MVAAQKLEANGADIVQKKSTAQVCSVEVDRKKWQASMLLREYCQKKEFLRACRKDCSCGVIPACHCQLIALNNSILEQITSEWKVFQNDKHSHEAMSLKAS